jgi:hypothetical protein
MIPELPEEFWRTAICRAPEEFKQSLERADARRTFSRLPN